MDATDASSPARPTSPPRPSRVAPRRPQFIPAWAKQPQKRVHTPCQVEPELWFVRGGSEAREACNHCPLRLQCLQETARAAAGGRAGRDGAGNDPSQRVYTAEGWAPTHGVWAGHRMPGRIVNRLITRYGELNDDLARNGLPTFDMPTAEEFNRRTGGGDNAATHADSGPTLEQPAARKVRPASRPRRPQAAPDSDQLMLPIAAA